MFEGKNGKDLFFDEFNRNISHLTSDLIRESKLDNRKANNLRNCSRSIRSAAKANRKTNNVIAARATLVLANSYVLDGYDVLTEYRLRDRFKHADPELVVDLVADKDDVTHAVEMENGGTPPWVILKWGFDEELYHVARFTSKIARYSGYADAFKIGLVAAALVNLDLDQVRKCVVYFMSDLGDRTQKETEYLTKIANMLYNSPKITSEQVREARLDGIYRISTGKRVVEELNSKMLPRKKSYN